MSSAYEVRVHGIASERLLESLCADLDMTADTVLHGVIEDQASLHGLLARIRDIGLEIVDVRQLSHWRATPPHDPPAAPRRSTTEATNPTRRRTT